MTDEHKTEEQQTAPENAVPENAVPENAAPEKPEESPPFARMTDQLTITVWSPADTSIDPIVFLSPRNKYVVLSKLSEHMQQRWPNDPPEGLHVQIKTPYLKEDGEGGDMVQISDDINVVLSEIFKMIRPTNWLTAQLYGLPGFLEVSRLTGMFVTATFLDGESIDISLVNRTLGEELTPEDVNRFVYTVETNLDRLKHGLKKSGHVLPDDSGGLILPSRFKK